MFLNLAVPQLQFGSKSQQPDLVAHRFSEIKPESLVTRQECQELIDAAIRRHNRNAGLISMGVGWVVLALFAEGVLRLIGKIPPIFPWLELSLS